MKRIFAEHVIRGTLGMEVASSRRAIEGPVTGADATLILAELDKYFEAQGGLEASAFSLGHLPWMLDQIKHPAITHARVKELIRRDPTAFIPRELAYSYEGLA